MICPNCGAEYRDAIQSCPFCGAENIKEANRQYKSELDSINRNIRNLEGLPRAATRKISGTAIKIIAVLLTAVMLYIIISSVVEGINKGESAKNEDKHLIKLEVFYKNGDYSGIRKYLRENDGLYGPKFNKYSEVADAFYYIQEIRISKACFDGTEHRLYNDIYFALDDGAHLLKLTREAINDNVVRDNETILQGFQNEVLSYFHDDLKLSDHEIEEILLFKDSSEFERLQAALVEKLNIKKPVN